MPAGAFTEKGKETLRDAWRGKWIAFVDDDTDDDEMLETLFPSIFGLGVVHGSRELEKNPDSVVVHTFKDSQSFFESQKAIGFDVCILDGRLGNDSRLNGLEVARKLHQMSPETVIIGRSAEPYFNNGFNREPGVVLVVPKQRDMPEVFPEIAGAILVDQEEEGY